jgi:hypothetical protein
MFTSGAACQRRETIPPRTANPQQPCAMLFSRAVVPGQRGRQNCRGIGHPTVVGCAPFHRRVCTEFCPQPWRYLRAGGIGQHEEGFAGKAGAAKEHAHLGRREHRPVQGDPRGVADNCKPTVPVTSCTMRGQATRAGAARQKVAPEGAVLCQVPAGNSPAGAFVFHVTPFAFTRTALSVGGSRW